MRAHHFCDMPSIAPPPDALLPSVGTDSFVVMLIGGFALVLLVISLIKLTAIWTTSGLTSKLDWLLKLEGLGLAWGYEVLREDVRK